MADSDPDEAVISLARGPHSLPYHPKDAQVYKICLLGARGAGKSAIAYRLVAHTFDEKDKATAEAQFSAQKGASSSPVPPCLPSVDMDMHMHLRRRRARGHGNAHAHARDATGPLHGQARPSRSCSPT